MANTNNKKKKIVDDATKISSSFLQPIFGGDPSAPVGDVNFSGHVHDVPPGQMGSEWGHVGQIDLGLHTTGRLTLKDAFAVSRSVSAYPSVVATPNNNISGAASLIIPTSPAVNVTFNSVTAPISGTFDGTFKLTLAGSSVTTGIDAQGTPLTLPTILTSAIWYFAIPMDMDTTKPAYFSFAWMGDILTTDGYGNTILDPSKLINGNAISQTTTFRITWQWYVPGYSVFAPAVIYDGYTPTNVSGTNIPNNPQTRGRIPSLPVNVLPFSLAVNDSAAGTPNYVSLTGLQQATNSVILGVQVDVLASGFISNNLLSGHINFFQGNLIYLSKTMGSAITTFSSL